MTSQATNISVRNRFVRVVIAAFGVGVILASTLLWIALRNTSSGQLLLQNMVAPEFALQDQDGRTHALHDYRNRPVAIAFIPDVGADSVVQLRSLNQNIHQFDTLGVKIFAITPAASNETKHVHDEAHLEFPVLADPDSRVARSYGVINSDYPHRRVSFVIGRDSRVILPVTTVNVADHGKQLSELTECCLDSKPQPASKLIGKHMADFALPRVADGRMETLYGANHSNTTVLFITSAECPCSAKYESRMTDLARTYGAKGVRFIAMNSSFGEEPHQIAEHALHAAFPFPVLKDEGNIIADRIDAQVTPEAFVMDKTGIVRYHGRIDDSRDPHMVVNHDLRNALDFLLGGKNPPHADANSFGCAILRTPKAAEKPNTDTSKGPN